MKKVLRGLLKLNQVIYEHKLTLEPTIEEEHEEIYFL